MFTETQRYSWPRITLLAGAFAAVLFAVFAFEPALDTPELKIPGVLTIACAVGMVIVTSRTQLVSAVKDGALRLQLRPFQRRERIIDLASVLSAVPATRHPFRDYRGVGIRGTANQRAYLLRGPRGVLLTLRNGRTLFVGSQKPEALLAAITPSLRP